MDKVGWKVFSKGVQGDLSEVVAFELWPDIKKPAFPRMLAPVRKNCRHKGLRGGENECDICEGHKTPVTAEWKKRRMVSCR